MFQNAAIDVAIGLILMYLMLSLLCTVVNEFIATKLQLRSSTLEDALKKLIDDQGLLDKFYDHGLIVSNFHAAATGSQTTLEAVRSGSVSAANSVAAKFKAALAAPAVAPAAAAAGAANVPPAADAAAANTSSLKQDHPSYLAGGTVALALMGTLLKRHLEQQQQPQQQQPQQQQPPQQQLQPEPQQQGAAVVQGFADVAAAIRDLDVAPKLKDALQASLLQANGDIDKLQKGIATWFDDAMDRLSGAYKRKMKWIAMLIGLVVAVALNADSFKVATTLWNDADRRASTIAVATEFAKKPLPDTKQSVDQAKLGKEVQNTEQTLRSLPIGWNCPAKLPDNSTDYWTCVKQKQFNIFQILGWLLTAAALSLGAPFWFDLLNQFINLRGAGAKPARQDKKTG